MRKRESRDQKRKRKLAKKQKLPIIFEFEVTAGTTLGSTLIRMRVPSGSAKMPPMEYQGQAALDRARKWTISYAQNRYRVPLDQHAARLDPAWFSAPAHGCSAGVLWKQWQTSRGARIDFQLSSTAFPQKLGKAADQEIAVSRLDSFSSALWDYVSGLSPAGVALQLAEGSSEGGLLPGFTSSLIFADGWSFQYSRGQAPDTPRYLCQFSAQPRPIGRPPDADDWRVLGAVLAELKAPSFSTPEAFLQFTDPQTADSSSRMTWRWFVDSPEVSDA